MQDLKINAYCYVTHTQKFKNSQETINGVNLILTFITSNYKAYGLNQQTNAIPFEMDSSKFVTVSPIVAAIPIAFVDLDLLLNQHRPMYW